MSWRSARWLEVALLLAILAGAFWLDRANADFALGLHVDEPRKAEAAQIGIPEYRHPHLLYHATRLAAAATGAQSMQEVAEAGRLVSALFGTAVVFVSFLLFRRRFRPATALAATALLAVTPILVVHSHYLKEDVCFTFATTLAMLALLRFAHDRTPRALLGLGFATGLAMAAKYAGVVLFAIYLLLPLAAPVGSYRRWLRSLAGVAGVALVVFAIVNAAGVGAPADLLAGARGEGLHAVRGHDVPIWGPSYGFAFHLLWSLVPGLGVAATLLALAGIVAAAWSRRRSRDDREERDDGVVLVAIAVLYLAIEVGPLKPFPNPMRYALPLAPLLIWFAAAGSEAFCARWLPRRTWAPAALLIAVAIGPAIRSQRLVADLASDTRFAAAERVRMLPGPVLLDDYSIASRWNPYPNLDLVYFFLRSPEEIARARYAVTSSFRYERYLAAANLPFQSDEIRAIAARYRRLLACPDRQEFRPRRESFAFSNPVVVIVDLESCREELR